MSTFLFFLFFWWGLLFTALLSVPSASDLFALAKAKVLKIKNPIVLYFLSGLGVLVFFPVAVKCYSDRFWYLFLFFLTCVCLWLGL